MTPEEAEVHAGAERDLARQLATLTLVGITPVTSASALQAAVWWNGLARLGITPPLSVVHDLGRLLSQPADREQLLAPRPAGRSPDTGPLGAYETLLRALAASESLAALGSTFMRDEVVAVLLARLMGEVHRRWTSELRGAPVPRGALPLASPLYVTEFRTLAAAWNPAWALSFLPHLVDHEVALLARLDQMDLGPVRLLGFFPPARVPPDLADLHQLLELVGAGDAVDFCLQLLPSLLETKRQGAPQLFAVDGYASIERRGGPDALVPSEIAHDPEVFDIKAISDELMYYGHERPREGARRVHGVLIDASASMRGVREVFARGLGLALAKKLSLMGTEVWLRFFDSRLHRRVDATALGGQELPYVLCFRSERGRNYARVFEDLLTEVRAERRRGKREVAITFITHAECHVPRPLVEALAAEASLYGVFVLPSQPLALDYLSALRRHQVVTAETLSRPADKRQRALDIVGDVIATGGRR